MDNGERLPVFQNFNGLTRLPNPFLQSEADSLEFGNVDLFHDRR